MDPEIARLMVEHEIDEDVAEKAQELIGEGLDEEKAIEVAEELWKSRLKEVILFSSHNARIDERWAV